MKTSSAKGKGRQLQKDVVMNLRHHYQYDIGYSADGYHISTNCYDGDIQARQMGGSGTDVILSPAAQKAIPFDIECKRQEKLNIWQSLEQTKTNTKEGRIPLLVFRRNKDIAWACLPFEDLLRLIK